MLCLNTFSQCVGELVSKVAVDSFHTLDSIPRLCTRIRGPDRADSIVSNYRGNLAFILSINVNVTKEKMKTGRGVFSSSVRFLWML